MKAAVQRLKMLSREKSMEIIEEAREKARRDWVAMRDFALEKGRTEGRITGMKEVALNLLKKNIDISIISETTGLSKSEILKLKDTAKRKK